MNKIDIVYTWVNGRDLNWNNKKSSYLKDSKLYNNSLEEQAGNIRFTDNNELMYSLRTIELFAPWVNHIYIITDNQKPNWINENYKITIIDHKEIIPEIYLPTFNSSVIEAHLHNIPQLKEKFIYFNDDMFLGKETFERDFFNGNIPNVFTSSIFPQKKKPIKNPTYNTDSILKSRNTVYHHTGKKAGYGIKHGVRPLLKSRLKSISEEYSKYLKPHYHERFRLTPFSLLYIYTFHELITKNAQPKYLKTAKKTTIFNLFPTFYYVTNSNIDYFSKNYQNLKPLVFCINEISKSLTSLPLFNQGVFSNKSKFEK